MADDLRTRIAAVLYERAMSRLAWHRSWDDLQPEVQQMWLEDAGAVVRELNMVQQNEMVKDGPVMPDGLQKMKLRYRYVTEWEDAR